MTEATYNEMSLDELLEWAYDNIDDLTTEDMLLEYVKQQIDNESIYMALHVLKAVYESEEAYNGYYLYDYNMGALETPTPVTCKADLKHLIDFDDE